ncbi:CDP-diacylglycerol--serine O-phosphatidyltransferase [Myxococcota bacterium]|nr:CDP-diacylglycerol--serine O-phosphatidyltransferase [Myxococcota bacterium]
MKSKTTPSFLYILPNLFTMSSLFAGFYAITLLSSPANKSTFVYAGFALLFATICDMLDGRVARLTGTQSDFGMQMDSLVDLVSFGIAPALLVYKWGLADFGFWGLLAAFSFAGAGACRLARFNVMEMQKKTGGASRHFVGLPIPLAAGMLISTIIYHEVSTGSALYKNSSFGILGLTIVLSYLMVSTIRFRTFKDIRINPQSLAVIAVVMGFAIFGAVAFSPAFSLVTLFAIYVAGGLLAEVVGYCGRLLRGVRVTSR